MIEDSYLTIEGTSEGSYKEKGSKFLAFAFPVSREEEVKAHLLRFRKEYYDARHICFAYILGVRKDSYKVSDDGEPPHTAGDPILNEIKSANLTNTLVIVVRYFGGTKLGKSGLIAAYRESAADALKNSKVVEKTVTEEFQVRFDYNHTSEVMNHLNILDAQIVSQDFSSVCLIKAAVRRSKLEEARKKLERFWISLE